MNLPVLEIAIGLALIYLMLAILCSSLMEVVAGFWNMRGEMLWRGIESLLGGEGAGGGLLRRLSLLKKAASGRVVPEAPPPGSRNDPLVRQLSAELLDHPLIEALRNGVRAPSYVPSNRFSTAFVDTLSKMYGSGAGLYADFAATVSALPHSKLRSQLELLLQEAGADKDKLRTAIERWFDETMDRVSGWYKRQTQWLLLAVAFITAVSMNIDSIEITRKLWRDPELRAIAVRNSEAFMSDYAQMTDKERQDAAAGALKTMELASLPMGWPPAWGYAKGWDFFGSLLLAMLGWIVTALAVSLGAPYWYDLLSRLLPLRAAGKKTDTPTPEAQVAPATTTTEPSAPATLIVSAPASPAPPAEPFLDALNDYEATALTEGDISEIQELLGVDQNGRLDEATRQAITELQERAGLPATGELNAALVRDLLRDRRT